MGIFGELLVAQGPVKLLQTTLGAAPMRSIIPDVVYPQSQTKHFSLPTPDTTLPALNISIIYIHIYIYKCPPLRLRGESLRDVTGQWRRHRSHARGRGGIVQNNRTNIRSNSFMVT